MLTVMRVINQSSGEEPPVINLFSESKYLKNVGINFISATVLINVEAFESFNILTPALPFVQKIIKKIHLIPKNILKMQLKINDEAAKTQQGFMSNIVLFLSIFVT